eukprot:CAMPEP_0173123078 /NCGR_PEP_ID=MMETSP1102-20130122/54674_1 /TAXON_ID=49646 /ORGANISM="Geminigera sp., Strain Caron Lab Isolate" /LENGTH=315 /DNA_ID=CAMNT_0014030821 /DNA_START=1288 /DNA_END=2232 /DNA_ORIENTATION=-
MDVTAVPWVPEDMLPHLYSRAAVFVYPSFLEGFGMPPIEAVACGCPVILGPFYKTHMQHYFGNDALYVMNVADMMDALTRVHRGDVASTDALIARARVLGGDARHGWNAAALGGDARHGWNAVARDYLVHMLQGPFREVNGSHCKTVGDALLAGRIAAATASYLQGEPDWRDGKSPAQRFAYLSPTPLHTTDATPASHDTHDTAQMSPAPLYSADGTPMSHDTHGTAAAAPPDMRIDAAAWGCDVVRDTGGYNDELAAMLHNAGAVGGAEEHVVGLAVDDACWQSWWYSNGTCGFVRKRPVIPVLHAHQLPGLEQ